MQISLLNHSLYILLALICAVPSHSAKRLKVVTLEIQPYVFKKLDGSYAGFLVDLLEEMAKKNGFTYDIYGVPDRNFGRKSGENLFFFKHYTWVSFEDQPQ